MPIGSPASVERREVEASGLFDARWYLAQAPEAAASGLDPIDHYLAIGGPAGLSPGPEFDSAWYVSRYNDVAAHQIDPLLHFIRFGRKAGRAAKPPAATLFDDFQSLGYNCEFGLVQRHFGCETLDLLRFATTPIKGLISFLKAGEDPFLSSEALEVRAAAWGEYNTFLQPFGFLFHSDVGAASLPLDRVRDHELRRLRFLWRKFVEDLEDGARLFVFKSGLQMSNTSIDRLVSLLRQRGPNHLLWVTPEEPGRPAGTVDRVGPGLMRGRVDKVNVGPEECSFDIWHEMCHRAHTLWRTRAT
jgi:hypothetical protein